MEILKEPTKTYGVALSRVPLPFLKQQLLLVDKIALYVGATPDFDSPQSSLDSSPAEADMTWLGEKGVVVEFDQLPLQKSLNFATRFDGGGQTLECGFTFSKSGRKLSITTERVILQTDCELPSVSDVLLQNYFARTLALGLAMDGANAVSLLPIPLGQMTSQQAERQKHQIVGVVLRQLPMPASTVSLEQILDFRSDPETNRKLTMLKAWCNKIAKGSFDTTDVEQELDHLIQDYEHHMNIHKMKIAPGPLETCITVSAEILEYLMKLQFGKLARSLFFLKERRRQLMEAESKIPGREIAYIVSAIDKFGSRPSR